MQDAAHNAAMDILTDAIAKKLDIEAAYQAVHARLRLSPNALYQSIGYARHLTCGMYEIHGLYTSPRKMRENAVKHASDRVSSALGNGWAGPAVEALVRAIIAEGREQ